MKRILIAFCASICMITPAFAQENQDAQKQDTQAEQPAVHAKVDSQIPFDFPKDMQNWEVASNDRGKYIRVFTNKKSQNRIEILGRNLVQEDYSDELYNAFEEQLKSNGFSVVGAARDENIVDDIKGKWASYDYTSETENLKIHISTYRFVYNNYMVIVVGYFSDQDYVNGKADMENYIKQIKTVNRN